jgi:hypothetical protein
MRIITQEAKTLQIKEQTLYNDSCGLTFEFVSVEDENFPFRLRIYGDILPLGNRELVIDKDGVIDGAGTATTDQPFPFDKD